LGEEPPRGPALKQVLLLVEGHTEERFVKDVMVPWTAGMDLVLRPTILVTKVVKDGPNFKGGVSVFSKIESDWHRPIRTRGPAFVSTILEYYRLPVDTPGMNTRTQFDDPLDRATHIEREIRRHFREPDGFLPFLALHEFEAWLFSCPKTLPEVMIDTKNAAHFAAVCSTVLSPEYINERPGFAPSKRIKDLYPSYQKVLHGTTAAKRIGLELMRAKCSHLDNWLTQLEQFAST